VLTQIKPTDPEVWSPNNFDEWVKYKTVTAFLPLCIEQEKSDSLFRKLVTIFSFSLILIELVAIVCLLVAVGLKYLEIPFGLFSVVFPSLFIEVVGLAYVIVQYLFNSNSRQNLRDLIKEAGQPTPPVGTRNHPVAGVKGTKTRIEASTDPSENPKLRRRKEGGDAQ
jgi:hypothetical protein